MNTIFLDELIFTPLLTTGQVYVSRQTKEEFDLDCFFPTVKHGWGYMMVWGNLFPGNPLAEWFFLIAELVVKAI